MLVLAVGVLLVTVILTVAMRDRHGAGLAAMALALAALLPAGGYTPVFVILAAFIGATGVLTRRNAWRTGPTATRALSVVGTVLVAVLVANSVQQGALTEAIHELTVDRATGSATADRPNLYVVLLDGYPGDDAAKLQPTFDADQFPDALTARGFEVQRHSRSNYLRTAHTLASMFSMRLLHGEPTEDELRPLLNEGAALDVLASHGYDITAISSGFSPLDIRSADAVVGSAAPSELEIALFRYTGLGAVVGAAAPDAFASIQRMRIEDTFALLRQAATGPRTDHPRFVFAHVPAPHGPWVFHADGAPRTEGLGAFYSDRPEHRHISRPEALDRVYEQAEHVSVLTLAAVDEVILRDPSAVIVLFSDHGPGTGFWPTDPLGSDLDERSSNFLAVRYPGAQEVFPPGTTPVNIFPRLFNRSLATAIEVQPDLSALAAVRIAGR